jgi:hypothetical protein
MLGVESNIETTVTTTTADILNFKDYKEAQAHFARVGCKSSHASDVCECRVSFPYPSCGRIRNIVGEDVADLAFTDGMCEICWSIA